MLISSSFLLVHIFCRSYFLHTHKTRVAGKYSFLTLNPPPLLLVGTKLNDWCWCRDNRRHCKRRSRIPTSSQCNNWFTGQKKKRVLFPSFVSGTNWLIKLIMKQTNITVYTRRRDNNSGCATALDKQQIKLIGFFVFIFTLLLLLRFAVSGCTTK